MAVINIIGAGRVGQTLAWLLSRQKGIEIGFVCNQTEASARAALQFIGQGKYCPAIEELPPADMTFITTPDSSIAAASAALSQSDLKPGGIVVHCSGALTSNALDALRVKGCYTASIHPMRSFAKPALSVHEFSGTYCAVEGDVPAISALTDQLQALGAIVFAIDKTKKPLYHAAGVFASNYLVTLFSQALSCLSNAGIDETVAVGAVLNLMQGTLANLNHTQSPRASLTGPITRADTGTITNHLLALTGVLHELYSVLGKATLPLTTLSGEQKQAVMAALGS
ncbi:Rossmann-like and DUF2520 domain-containing protein [Legionella taurinensis]|uniref:DUF2520 domain-containing protein n=1 Tax=Legionella taurinensis TaxID=70611 RepID=A0A3A5L6X8_9GAMM|nr:Rossmann-like and DUF2520 domain-containing protein [Legionella taurinensis]RJT48784.1 DUF2520 domain-containing protein [Legionella taurinensis]RJT69774.1 DUF2520 domain-containing protein [Legionella taurinensis]STY24857.1 Uncharacterized conserved protein [Legionella taurinensis]